jgi:hypothetical protein
LPRTSINDTIGSLCPAAFGARLKPGQQHGPQSLSRMSHTLCKQSKAVQAQALMIQNSRAEIEVEGIGDIPPQKIHILLTNPCANAPMIELSDVNLKYLQSVVVAQLGAGKEYRKRPRRDDGFNNEGYKGISKDYRRNKLRAVVITEEGKRTCEYFPIFESHHEEALESAKSFIRGDIEVVDAE